MSTPALARRALLGALAAAPALATAPAVAAAPQLTPFRIAEARYRAATARLNASPDDLPTTNPAEYDRLVDAHIDATDAVDRTPVTTWDEFADAYEIACDGGESLPPEKLIFKLLADVRRLRGRD